MGLLPFEIKSINKMKKLKEVIHSKEDYSFSKVGGQAVLGRQNLYSTPWLTKRHGYDPTYSFENE